MRRAVRRIEVGSHIATLLNRKCRRPPDCFREKSPSPPFRGEREGPRRDSAGEGEVGCAANRVVSSPHPALSPGQRGVAGASAYQRARWSLELPPNRERSSSRVSAGARLAVSTTRRG